MLSFSTPSTWRPAEAERLRGDNLLGHQMMAGIGGRVSHKAPSVSSLWPEKGSEHLVYAVSRSSHTFLFLIREVKAGKDGASFLAETIIDPAHHVWPDDPPKTDPRCHAIVPETDILE
jgi:hypothetical protein